MFGESVRLAKTELIVGQRIPWWLACLMFVVLVMTYRAYRMKIGMLARKLGDGVTVNTVYSKRVLLGTAYGLSGALYGLGAAFYTHKIGTARAGGGFEFLVVSSCSYMCVSRLTYMLKATISRKKRLSNVPADYEARNPRAAELITSPEFNAIVGALFYGTLVPVVLAFSPSPTSWKLILAGCLILALVDYSAFARPFRYVRRIPRLGSVPRALTINSLTFAYSEGPVFRPVFNNAVATFPRGLNLVKGANGTGKSTLLKLLGGQIESYYGSIDLDGNHIESLPSHARPVYLTTQNPFHTIGASLTVFETVSSAAMLQKKRQRINIRKDVVARLKDAGFSNKDFPFEFNPYNDSFWYQRVSDLSAGQAAVIALLSSLTSGLPIIALDEPTTGLDSRHFDVLRLLLLSALRDHIIIVSTHDERLNELASAIFVVGNGCLQELRQANVASNTS